MPRHYLVLLLTGLLIPVAGWAQQPPGSAGEARLREGLRAATTQLRAIQTERDQLAIEKLALEAEKTELAEKLAAATKEATTYRDTAQKTVAALEASLAVREKENTDLAGTLARWQASQKEAVALAGKKERERATAAARVIELERQVADQQRRNAAMFKVGNEVLRRYEKFVLGDALAAREPFTGIARVKFQTLAQDFQDQLYDARVESGSAPAAAAPATPPPAPRAPMSKKAAPASAERKSAAR